MRWRQGLPWSQCEVQFVWTKSESTCIMQIVSPPALHQTPSQGADCGMFGGWPYLAYQFLQKAGGIFSEADWPYASKDQGMYPCMPEGRDRFFESVSSLHAWLKIKVSSGGGEILMPQPCFERSRPSIVPCVVLQI